jgi:transposase
MSTSLFSLSHKIDGVHLKKAIESENGLELQAVLSKKLLVCAKCQSHNCVSKGIKRRRIRTLPTGATPAFLLIDVPRLKCKDCSHNGSPRLPFVAGRRRMTKAFQDFILRLVLSSTVDGAARLLKVSWDTVKDIHKAYLLSEYKDIEYQNLRYVGIDEFSLHKGHEYMTIVIDFETRQIIHAVEGKDKAAIEPFLKTLSQRAHNLKAVAMDMSAAYYSAVAEHLPGVKIVFDKFHVLKLINDAIDEIRREQQRKCNEVGLRTLKGMRFLLLSNYENLDSKRQKSLESLLTANAPLMIAHAMKEQFRIFWSQGNRQGGMKYLCIWFMDAIEAGIGPLARAARSLLHRYEGLLNYFDHRITNGITEGINNKIKTLKRQAYGFRDMVYFKLRLYNLHKQRYTITG